MTDLLELAEKMPQAQALLAGKLPEVMQGFQSLKQAVEQGKHLSAKQRALIALAVAVAKQCEPCLAVHLKAAWEAGASEGEIMEACSVAILMGGGPAVAYTTLVAEALDQLSRQRGR
jgi:AhpD family alkylhydroperoxidase